MQPIVLYTKVGSPNPYKVTIFLEELGLPYELAIINNPKDESFLKINPNGRLPAIKDPNNKNIILWESGAILEYIVEKYDKENKLNATDPDNKWYIKQYLHFQMSGQGPYFGQAVWFHKFHPEDVPSAKKRYIEQAVRVFEVLDNILKDKEYLVEDKLTYADLAFVPWTQTIADGKGLGGMNETYQLREKYPNFFAWHERLLSRPNVQKGLEGQKTFASG